MLSQPAGAVREPLQFAAEGPVGDGWQEGAEFGGGFGLQFLQGVHLGLKIVKVGTTRRRSGVASCDGKGIVTTVS